MRPTGRRGCQQRVSTTRAHQRRRAWWRHSAAVPYNSRTTRRAPTGSYWRRRQRFSAVPIRSFNRENTDERPRGPMGVGALITRRSQVQILPPPPIAPGQRPFPLRRGGPRLLPGVNALSTRLGVGAHGHPCAVVGARAIGSVLVTRRSAGTAAHENRREHAGAVFCLDHLGHNPKVLPAQRCRHVRVPARVTGWRCRVSDRRVWFITCAGRGVGESFARAAVAAGHAVVATGRRVADVERVFVDAPTCSW
jgi:hypothetical protein